MRLRGNISMMPLQSYTGTNSDFRRVEWCTDCGPLCAAGWGCMAGWGVIYGCFFHAGLFSAEYWEENESYIQFVPAAFVASA